MARSTRVAPPSWQAGDRGYTCTGTSIPVVVDPDRPDLGVHPVPPPRDHDGPGPAASSERLLAVLIDGAPEAADHWVRGTDLTGVYEPSDPRRLRAMALWRALDRGSDVPAGDAWMVVVSAQTALLDSDPRLDVVSHVSGSTIRWHDGGEPAPRWRDGPAPGARAVLIRGPAGRSTLVAVHPADCRSLEAAVAAGRTTIRCGLFGDSVEKGVLLRGRVLGAIGPAADDEAWAGRLLARFIAAPPPLTT